MTFYTVFVYAPGTGRILRRTICSDEDRAALLAEVERCGEAAVLTTDANAGRWDDTTHRVVDGQLVRTG